MTRINIILLLCVVLTAAGCGESAEERIVEKQIEKATGADADVDFSKDGMKVTGKTEEGKFTITTGEKTEIPKDFPTDVFIYRPSKAIMVMKIPEGYSVALTTQDGRSKVVSAYGREMEAKGWSEEASMNMGPQSMLVYQKNERTANISIGSSDQGLQINVMAATK
jgi:hypothetical protein